MDRKKKLYNDILNALTLIEEFTITVNLFEEYISDSKTKSAVERQLSIVGEALTQLRKLDAEELAHTKQIIGLRNMIVHAYDTIDDSIIWSIVKRHIAPLKQEVVEKLMND
ncbi:HepT-like ribonuclease domain-containing protein [uncultured Mucilaginibacter sp.]|uniref:HepT-like ribonuclease domain-containing protein n=1 Tax=uncultured Mucilaginibacter sp. TaxID=797541 RepID=UPI0025CCD4A3|nr:HepT-like ribonuclease domain-containing protein [uncultured Mucilaginibacter sp.]